ARHLATLLHGGTRLLSAHVPQLDLDRWVSNRAWYLERHFDFWIPPDRQEEQVLARFGPPAARADCSGVHLLVYDRGSDVPFRNFLRLPALVANDLALPSHIRAPAQLNTFRPNGADAANGVVIDGALDVAFDPPASGDVIEIAAEGGAELDLEIFDRT